MFPSEDFYWDLTLKDGQVIPIPPAGVGVVRRKMELKEPISTSNGVIPFSEIKSYNKTSRRKIDVPLLEEAAAAFGEPLYNDEGDMKARWVKKEVTVQEYGSFYGKSPGYRRLEADGNGMVWVAWAQPVHRIDTSRMSYCTEDEIIKLTKTTR